MEFFIKRGATLPVLSIDVNMDGRNDFNLKRKILGGTFSMKDEATGNMRIFRSPINVTDSGAEYQFTKRNTLLSGRFIGEFDLEVQEGNIILPVGHMLHINIVDSILGDMNGGNEIDQTCC